MHVNISYPSAICWKHILSPSNCLFNPCWKYTDDEDLLLDSQFITLIYLSILMAVPHYLHYCSFVVNWKSRNVSPAIFFFLFKIVLSVLGPFIFIWLLGLACQFMQKWHWNFDRDWVEFLDQFREYCHVNKEHPIHEYSMSFH